MKGHRGERAAAAFGVRKAPPMLYQTSHTTTPLGLPLQTPFINKHRAAEEGCCSLPISKC